MSENYQGAKLGIAVCSGFTLRLPWLLMLHDGPLLEQSLKAIAGVLIRVPRSKQHQPDRDRFAVWYEQLKLVAQVG
jgi:hypothetical protein